MALWTHADGRWNAVNLARADLGLPVFLCCPGPSLKKVERQPGLMVAALTKAWPAVDADVWFGMDDPLCYDRRLWWSPMMKVSRSGLQDLTIEGRALKSFAQTFFADPKRMQVHEIFEHRDGATKFCWHEHSLGMALHGLVWMGAKRIYLVGCDMGGAQDWHTGSDLSDHLRKRNRLLYEQQVEFLRRFQQHGAAHGIELVSCTAASPINEHMAYVPVEQAVALAKLQVPPAGKAYHCMDAETVRKSMGGGPVTDLADQQLKSLLKTIGGPQVIEMRNIFIELPPDLKPKVA
jgi:hypothetical protein